MSDNKFIKRLKGEQTAKSVLEIKNESAKTSFANMPQGTSNAINVYSDHRGNATAVLNGTINWKVSNSELLLADAVSGDGQDFTSTYSVSGSGLWVNASYTFPSTGDPRHPVAMVFNPSTKWVLKVCGDNLIVDGGSTVDFTMLVKIGTASVYSKNFTIRESAGQFSKEFIIDFGEANSDVIKAGGLSTLTVQLLCGTANASARIYNGMTVLTCLQRKVDASAVSNSSANVEDVLDGNIIPSDYFSNPAFIDQIEDGDTAVAIFARDGDDVNLDHWEQPIPDRTGNAGKFLQTPDGDKMSWEDVEISDVTGLQTELNGLQGQITTNKNTMDLHIGNTNNPHQVTKAQVGLSNVDNTSDLNKPISTATQTALDLKADKSTTYTKTETDTLLSGKQDTISDLTTIRSNAQAGKAASDTIATYGDIVTHDVSEFATAAQGAKADTALQAGDNVSELVNDAGYLTQHQTLADLGITATASEINVLDGITANTTELNYTDGVTSNIQTQLNNKISYNAIIQNLNSFNNNGKLFLSTLDNCFYSLNRRFTVTGTGFTSFNAAALFDGVFENYSYNNINVGGTGVITITGSSITGTYRQGYILISFYSGRGVKSASDVTIQIENSLGNVATLTPTTYSSNGLVLIAEVPTLPTANAIAKITITIVNNRTSGTVNPVELEYFCSRPSNIGLLSYVSKTGNNTIYGILTADSFVKSGGTSSQFLKADGSVDSTAYAPMSSIPTVNNATLTIQKNGTTVQTFTANQGTNATANISVPTKTSDITNDSGFITSSALAPYALSADLATVATSGDYNDLSNKPTIPTVGNGTITITQGGISKGTFTTNQSGNTTIALDAGGGSDSSYRPDLFDVKWADHILDDAQWLRADTFSWQSGAVYQAAYAHLVLDIDGKTLQSETISGTTIQFYLADDGHKICPASQESNVTTIYNATGVAWYYIIDTTNQRFKLPRTKFGFTGIRSSVGKFVSAGLPNITANWANLGASASASGAVNVTKRSWGNRDAENGQNSGAYTLDASRSSSIYGNSTTVQPKATEMYLYFYVGNFTQTALENTAGLNTELFNGKAGIDLDNLSSAGKAVVAHMAMPSNRYINLTLGASGSTYTAPSDGYVYFCKTATATNQSVKVTNETSLITCETISVGATNWCRVWIPVSKNDRFTVTYNVGGETRYFRFIYANGSK